MFPTILKRLRNQLNLSQDELVSRLNKNDKQLKFSKASLSRWEDGQSSPSILHAKVIADFFGVTVDALVGAEEIPNDLEEKFNSEVIAAHIDDDVTDEEMNEILNFIDFMKNKR